MSIEELKVKISADITGLVNAVKTATDQLDDVADTAKEVASKVASAFQAAGKAIAKVGKGVGSVLTAPLKSLSKGIKESLNKIKGMFEQAFTFGLLSKAFQSIGTSITNYIGNNEALSNSLSKLKGSLLTALTPIIEVMIPILEKLINTLSRVFNTIARFTTTLTGKTVKATQEEAKALENLSNSGKKSTASFDSLNILSSTASTTDISAQYEDLAAAEEKQLTFMELFDIGLEKITNGFKVISDKAREFVKSIDLSEMIGKLFSGVTELIGPYVGLISDLLNKMVQGALDFITSGGLVTFFDTLLTSCVEGITSLVNTIFSADWGEITTQAFDMVVSLIDNVATMIQNIDWGAIVNSIIDVVFSLLDNLFNGNLQTSLSNIIGSILGAIVSIRVRLKTKIIESIHELFKNLKEKGLGNTIKEYFSNMLLNPLKALFSGFWNGLSDEVKEKIINFITGLKESCKKIGDAISGGFKAGVNGAIKFINGLITGFTNAINKVITLLNQFSIEIPSWLGGGTIGFNIKPIEAKLIPYLATGGIITKPTTAVVGESGAEAVLPLENNTGWMDKLAGVFAERLINKQPEKIILNVDGRQLGWAAINNINSITKQSGSLQLALG